MKARKITLLIFTLVAATSSLPAFSDPQYLKTPIQILQFTELGKVRIGMTPKEAASALDGSLAPLDTSDGASSEECWYTYRTDRMSPWIHYMVQDDKIVRIDVSPIWVERGVRFAPPVQTDMGITVDSPEKSVIEKYGSRATVEPHPYAEETGHYLEVVSPDGKFGVLFETTDGKVDTFRSGVLDAVRAVEGCL